MGSDKEARSAADREVGEVLRLQWTRKSFNGAARCSRQVPLPNESPERSEVDVGQADRQSETTCFGSQVDAFNPN